MTHYRYFKFRPINKYLIESLVNPSWYFSDPAHLNDPFDCNVNLRAAFIHAAKTANGRRKQFLESALEHPTLLDNFGAALSKVGVCAFSLGYKETLMWSHYADEHRGVCILYRFPADFINDPANEFLGLDKVNYGRKALVEMLSTTSMEMNTFMDALLETYLTTKAPAWRYEKEARMVRGRPGLLPIPGEFIEQICFGLNASEPDIDLITKLARAYTSCRRFARIERTGHEFGLTMARL